MTKTSQPLVGRAGEVIGGEEGAGGLKQKRVGAGVVGAADGGVALVVEAAVGQGEGEEELPDGVVVPVQQRGDAHDGWPVARGGREGTAEAAVGVVAADAQQHRACEGLLAEQLLEALADVRAGDGVDWQTSARRRR